ncbi:unnamed protein product [Closterium sp. NIES-53]
MVSPASCFQSLCTFLPVLPSPCPLLQTFPRVILSTHTNSLHSPLHLPPPLSLPHQIFKMEDVSMGMWVVQYGINNTIHYIHNWRFCQFGCMDDYLTAHYQSPRQMLCMWTKLSRGEARTDFLGPTTERCPTSRTTLTPCPACRAALLAAAPPCAARAPPFCSPPHRHLQPARRPLQPARRPAACSPASRRPAARTARLLLALLRAALLADALMPAHCPAGRRPDARALPCWPTPYCPRTALLATAPPCPACAPPCWLPPCPAVCAALHWPRAALP